jgi:16S rRNA (uracil1498-N3)-methyltransferase
LISKQNGKIYLKIFYKHILGRASGYSENQLFGLCLFKVYFKDFLNKKPNTFFIFTLKLKVLFIKFISHFRYIIFIKIMALPFFYIDQYNATTPFITLNEETSKHIVQVLRMRNGEQLNLTDGNGNLLTAQVSNAHKKNCEVKVMATTITAKAERQISIGISLVKNASRFEWFLEKATELGVHEIIPLICERTERQHFRYERMNGILVSAMLQSQQVWLPVMSEPVKFNDCIKLKSECQIKLIAHCEEATKQQLSEVPNVKSTNSIILIGPEGDFTPDEIEFALQNHFLPVALGETRLRTETAGVAAAVLLCIK